MISSERVRVDISPICESRIYSATHSWWPWPGRRRVRRSIGIRISRRCPRRGELFAFPYTAQFLVSTDAVGHWEQTTLWPASIPPGIDFVVQGIVQDGSVPAGLVLTDAVTAKSP